MKKIFLSMALIGFLAVFGGKLEANDNITLEDLKPQFEHNDGPDFTRPVPKIETDYDRFENWVKERRESDGFGLSYDSDNKAPVIIYKDSFN